MDAEAEREVVPGGPLPVQGLRVREHVGVAVDERGGEEDALPLADRRPVHLDVLDREALQPLGDGEEAQQLLDHDGRRGLPRAQRRQLTGVAQQGERAERDHVRGRLVSGDEQDQGEGDEVLPAHGSVRTVPVDQLVQQPLPRIGAFAVDQRAEVLLQFDAGRVHVVRARTAQEPARTALEERVVGVGHAEEGADHHGRHRQREVGDQFGRRPLPLHGVQQPVHRLLDTGAQRGDPFHGEARDEHPALGVVLGVVDAEQGHTPLPGLREPLGRDGEGGVGAVGGESGVGQEAAGQGVSGDGPDRASVVERDPAQRPVRAQRFVPGGRVVGALAVLRERWGGGRFGGGAGEGGVLAGRFRRGFRHGIGRLAVLGDRSGAGRSGPHTQLDASGT